MQANLRWVVLGLALVGVESRSCQANVINLVSTEDSYIRNASGFDSTPFGTETKLLVKTATVANGNFYKTYIRFDFTGYNRGLLTNADLFLTGALGVGAPANVDYTFELFGIEDNTYDTWHEGGGTPITWVNATSPGGIGGIGNANVDNSNDFTDPPVTADLASFTVHGTGAGTEFHVAEVSEILDFIKNSSDDSVTFLIQRLNRPTDSYVNAFSSHEAGGILQPRLAVEFAPEPSSLLLIGTGLIGLAYRVRRRSMK